MGWIFTSMLRLLHMEKLLSESTNNPESSMSTMRVVAKMNCRVGVECVGTSRDGEDEIDESLLVVSTVASVSTAVTEPSSNNSWKS